MSYIHRFSFSGAGSVIQTEPSGGPVLFNVNDCVSQ